MCGCQRQPGSTTDVVARLRFLWSGVKGDVCFKNRPTNRLQDVLNRHDSRSHAFSVPPSRPQNPTRKKCGSRCVFQSEMS